MAGCPYFNETSNKTENSSSISSINYESYLKLNKILEAQEPISFKYGAQAHDEHLFIIIHQTYELWFKQLIFELDSIIEILNGPA
jgi:tryptophan 2,3-dioxygenase